MPRMSIDAVMGFKRVQRDINILSEATSDRLAKKRALEKIQKELKSETDALVATETFKLVVRPLLKCLSDPVEKCRELAVTIIEK